MGTDDLSEWDPDESSVDDEEGEPAESVEPPSEGENDADGDGEHEDVDMVEPPSEHDGEGPGVLLYCGKPPACGSAKSNTPSARSLPQTFGVPAIRAHADPQRSPLSLASHATAKPKKPVAPSPSPKESLSEFQALRDKIEKCGETFEESIEMWWVQDAMHELASMTLDAHRVDLYPLGLCEI